MQRGKNIMTFTLYRRMSDSELNKTLKTKGFIRPLGEVALLRKWLSYRRFSINKC